MKFIISRTSPRGVRARASKTTCTHTKPHALRDAGVAYQKDPDSLRHSLPSEACQMGRDGLGAQSIILNAMRCDLVRAGRVSALQTNVPAQAPEMGAAAASTQFWSPRSPVSGRYFLFGL
jgi:hypothetical protein